MKCKTFSIKKSPEQERSTTVKLGSKVHDTKDMLDGRISCRLTFVTLVNFQSLIQWLLKCLTHKEIWRNDGTFQTTILISIAPLKVFEKLSPI